MRISDLAKTMIRMSGNSLSEIRIEFSGLRPGEKLYEELLGNEDTTLPTGISALRIARLGDRVADDEAVRTLLAELESRGRAAEGSAIRELLWRLPLSYSGKL